MNRTFDQASASSRPLPIVEILGIDLPSREVTDALVDTYFYTVHWFSLVVYEPKFRARYTIIMDRGLASPSDRGFLLLLLMIMVIGLLVWFRRVASRNSVDFQLGCRTNGFPEDRQSKFHGPNR